ncbi:MAG: ArsB/NhaD family transporter, partial [Candidatus Nanopelagicales bacterium]|nr:ArsB/NhaD family transporter [Candidatus Nanopelagicales bacterium]
MTLSLAIAIFVLAYVLIASEKISRIAIALGGAAAMFVIGATDADKAFYSHETGIDWNVIFLLLGMMIIVGVIHKTGLFEFLAIKAIKKADGSPKKALVFLIILVAFSSAILDNVTTILLAVPMTIIVCKQLNVNPIPFLLSEVFASNIGGAATLVGDPPNIIIASRAGLSFNDFLIHMAPLVIVAMLVITPILVWMFRKELVNTAEDRARVHELDASSYLKNPDLLKKSLAVLSLVVVGFLAHSVIHAEPSVIALIGAGLLISISGLKPVDYVQDVEWGTLVFFAGLFVMVGALVNVGALQMLSDYLAAQVDGKPELATGVLLVLSAVVSGIVDNIPYVATMSPVVADLSAAVPAQHGDVLWWALAFGADFGGNATIIGASANVVAIGLAAKAGIKISFWQFAKYGIPITVISIAIT